MITIFFSQLNFCWFACAKQIDNMYSPIGKCKLLKMLVKSWLGSLERPGNLNLLLTRNEAGGRFPEDWD